MKILMHCLRVINLKLKAILGKTNLSKFFASGRTLHNLGILVLLTMNSGFR